MELSRPILVGAALVVAVAVGPWLARVAARLAARDETVRPAPARIAVVTALFAGLLVGAVELMGARPATAPPSSSGRWTWTATGCRTA